jgi:hypothetical protein
MGVTFVLILLFCEETKYRSSVLDGSDPVVSTVGESNHAVSGDEKTLEPEVTAPRQQPPRRSHVHDSGLMNSAIPKKSIRQRLVLVTNTPGSWSTIFSHMWQPFVILACFPSVAFTALQYAASLSWIAITANTQSILFPAPPYNFSPAAVGLLNLPPFIGALFGLIWGGPLSDRYIVWRATRNSGVYEPEMRLPMLLLPSLITPAGVWLYGLTMARGYHWIVPCVGSGLLGLGVTSTSDIALTYLVDSYPDIVGDALIGVAFIRNGLSTALVFGIPPWMNDGVYDMFVAAGCVSMAISFLYVPMIIWGKDLRAKTTQSYILFRGRQYGHRGL